MLLLDALYINNSGGKVLLDILIKELHNSSIPVFFLLDKRCEGSYSFLTKENTLYLKANLRERYKFYKTHETKFTKVLCFGNIPPPIRLKAQVFTYFHNINLLVQPKKLPFKTSFILKLKGLYIQWLKNNVDDWLVQSENMQDVMSKSFNIKKSKIGIYPFYKSVDKITIERPYDSFFYISNGNSHKNHQVLLDAWEMLFAQGLKPSLSLTITNTYAKLIKRIEDLKNKGLRIENKGWVNPIDLYKNHRYLVYPSLAESFGLGLVEAIEAGCEVIGANLPYTNAVVEPLVSFNPTDSQNLTDTIKELMIIDYKDQKSKVLVKNKLQELIRLVTD